jgi:GNAT superfamily N-acetyltransferase
VIDPLVRVADPADVEQLIALEAEARAELVERRGGARWLDTHAARGPGWDATIATGGAVVAHIDDVVVGYLVATVSDSIVHVDEVYVTPSARELGFGDALLAAAVEIGRAAGCELIEGEALPGDRDTKNLYERAGITARLITVSRRLV